MLIIPDNSEIFNVKMKEALGPVISPDVTVDVVSLKQGNICIEGRYDLSVNAPYVIEIALHAEKDGYDGIVVSDMDMCGVEAAREVLDIPIIGGFRACAYTAMMIAQRFSIITVLDSVVALQTEHVRAFGITENFASIRSVDMGVTDLTNTELAVERVFDQSLKAVEEDGAQAIILGCTCFVGVAAEVAGLLKEAGKPAPVLDPNCTAVSYMELLVRNNLSQSRLTYYKPANFK